MLQAVACNFIKKETMAQVLYCEFCEISKNTFMLQNTFGGCFCKLQLPDGKKQKGECLIYQ